jgi:hypothetical protein
MPPAAAVPVACYHDRIMSSSPDFTPKIIACETLRDEYMQVAADVEVEFVKGMLHDYPEKLRAELSQRIAATPGRRTILLGYGRCSNGTAGLQAGPHRLVLPAVDDCIALLLGSRRRYLEEFKAFPGTYYYTRGWVDYIDDPYQEYLKMIPRYGEEKAERIARLILANYSRVALVDTGTYPLEQYEPYVDTVAAFYGLPKHKLRGSLRLFEKLVRGRHDAEFIVVEPGGVLDEGLFWALPSEPEQCPAECPAACPAR